MPPREVFSLKRPHGARTEAERRRVRHLLLFFGIPALVLLVAEITDTLIGDAGPLALLVVVAGCSFYVGFVSREPFLLYREYAKGGFVVMLLLIGLVGYFGVREKQAVGELARIIDPVPEITDVLYLPTGGELQAIQTFYQPPPASLGKRPTSAT